MSKIAVASLIPSALIASSILLISCSPGSNEQKKPAAQTSPQLNTKQADTRKTYATYGDRMFDEQKRKAQLEDRKTSAEYFRLARERAFDTNGDGTLDGEERKAMIKASKAIFDNFIKEREKKFDADGNGTLSEEERKAMAAEIQSGNGTSEQQIQDLLKRFKKDGQVNLREQEHPALTETHAERLQK